jgi:acylphosphatase
MVKAKVYVSGKVQGVGYRYFVYVNARKLGLRGYVKNLNDGRVEAVFVGDKGVIEKMIDIMRDEHPFAEVKDIEVSFEDVNEYYDNFVIARE